MRYEVYGVYNSTGTNYLVGVAQSMKKAIEMVRKRVSFSCEFWAILEKERRHSIPLGIISGRQGGPPTRETSLVVPSTKYGNPITNQEDGARYWKGA